MKKAKITQLKSLYFILFFSILFNRGYSQTVNLKTEGDYSPAVWAKNISITYGTHPKIINELVNIFSKDGLDLKSRQKKVENILDKYSKLEQNEQKSGDLSPSSMQKIGIEQSPSAQKAMQWFAYTKGSNSPAIFSSGDVEIWYGISPEAFKGIFNLLMKKEGDILYQQGKAQEIEKKLKKQILLYKQLKSEWGNRVDLIAIDVRRFLENGEIDKVIEIQTSQYEKMRLKRIKSQKDEAKSAFDLGRTLYLTNDFQSALNYFKVAVQLDSSNYYYKIELAALFSDIGDYNNTYLLLNNILIDSTLLHKESPAFLAKFYLELGSIYRIRHEYIFALKYLEKAINLVATNNIKYQTEIMAQNQISLLYSEYGNYRKGISEYLNLLCKYERDPFLKDSITGIIYGNLAMNYIRIGEFNKAKYWLNIALEKEDSILFGRPNPKRSIIYSYFTNLYSSLNNDSLALYYVMKSIECDSILYGKHSVLLGTHYNNLANIYLSIGNNSKAFFFQKKSFELDSTRFGYWSTPVAICLNNLAVMNYKLGNSSASMNLYLAALGIDTIIYKTWAHPSIIGILNNIGLLLTETGDFISSQKWCEKALEISRKINTPIPEIVSDTYRGISDNYYKRGLIDSSQLYLKYALDIDSIYLGLNNYRLANIYSSWGDIEHTKGNFKLSLEYYSKGLNIFKSLYGDSCVHITSLLRNISSIYCQIGLIDSCAFYIDLAFFIDSLNYGNDSHYMIANYTSKANIIAIKSNYSNDRGKGLALSLSYYDRAIKLATKDNKIDTLEISKIYANSAETYMLMFKVDSAINRLELAKSLTLKKTGSLSNDIAILNNNIADIYQYKKQYRKALTYYLESIQITKKAFGDLHSNLSNYYLGISQCYRQLVNIDSAIFFANKAIYIDTLLFGHINQDLSRSYTELAYCYNYLNNYDSAFKYICLSTNIDSILYGINDIRYVTKLQKKAYCYYNYQKFNNAVYIYENIAKILFDNNYSNSYAYVESLTYAGISYSNLDKFDNAILLIKQAIDICKKNTPSMLNTFKISSKELALVYRNKGSALSKNKNFFDAIIAYKTSEAIMSEINDTSFTVSNYGAIGNIYRLSGNCDSALFYIKKGIYTAKKFDYYTNSKYKSLPKSQLNTNKTQTELKMQLYTHLIGRMEFRKSLCLRAKGKSVKSKLIYQKVKARAIKRNDQNLLDIIKSDW